VQSGIRACRRESYYMHDGRQVRLKLHFAEVRVKVIED
jgi:hypothetical protein